MLNFLEDVVSTTGTGAEAAPGSMLTPILMMVIMVAIFYFILIRPENKRKKEAQKMREAVKVGDKVVTIGGIVGTVVSVKDDRFVMETSADQVRIEFEKWALSTNTTADEKAKEEAAKAQEAKAKAKAAKQAEKANKNNR
jgi:preprotein translocase subunit YajC